MWSPGLMPDAMRAFAVRFEFLSNWAKLVCRPSNWKMIALACSATWRWTVSTIVLSATMGMFLLRNRFLLYSTCSAVVASLRLLSTLLDAPVKDEGETTNARIPAAEFARVMRYYRALNQSEGAGKAGCQPHPRPRTSK